ncbi:hypothetical protein V6N12_020218 [Hibiscus sabdariffa]|uniref:Uncharacterized protein n=1 Tax=Hibiscus sabdariffa TaxID=183260 RepID=A0ABR2BNA7_9ROSI
MAATTERIPLWLIGTVTGIPVIGSIGCVKTAIIAFGFFPQPVAPVWEGSSLETSHLWGIKLSRNLHSGFLRIPYCWHSRDYKNYSSTEILLSFFSLLYAFNNEISKDDSFIAS